MIFNKEGEPLLTISEAKKISDKSGGEQGHFDTIVEGARYVVDKKIYPEIINKDTNYYKAKSLGIDTIDE